jgi:hypothetical protein
MRSFRFVECRSRRYSDDIRARWRDSAVLFLAPLQQVEDQTASVRLQIVVGSAHQKLCDTPRPDTVDLCEIVLEKREGFARTRIICMRLQPPNDVR